MNIFLFRPIEESKVDSLRSSHPDCNFLHSTDPRELESSLPSTDIVFGNPPPSLLAGATRLRWVQIVSSGFDEYQQLSRAGFLISTAHGIHSESLAQHVLMTMLMFARGNAHFSQCQGEARWDRSPSVPFSLRGQTVGLIGFGGVGQELRKVLSNWGTRLLAVKRDPTPTSGVEVLKGAEGIDRLLAESQHIVVSLPKTAETVGILDKRRVDLMRNGAFIYNIARGGLVDEVALLERLESGTLGGAALDVFAEEPLPRDSPWWKAPNTLITPHIAGHHRDLGKVNLELFEKNLARFLNGSLPLNLANFERGY